MSTKKIMSEPNSLNYPLEIDGEDMAKEILKPLTYSMNLPGNKFVRQNLVNALRCWVTLPEDKFEKIDNLIHLLLNCSLMVDDIQDSSTLRRGIPAIYTVYGITKTAITASWMEAMALEILIELDNLELTKQYLKTIAEIFAGQGLDLYYRDSHICPTEAEYLQIAYGKSCLGFLIVLKTVNTFATEKVIDIEKLLTIVPMYMQIKNDYQNLNCENYFNSKGFCEDISEGKFSFPVVHAVNNFPEEGKQIMDILRQRTYDVDKKKLCLSLLEKCGSLEHTRKKIEELKSTARAEVEKIGGNPIMLQFIEHGMMAIN